MFQPFASCVLVAFSATKLGHVRRSVCEGWADGRSRHKAGDRLRDKRRAFLVCGPSGAGKDTILENVRAKLNGCTVISRHLTRGPEKITGIEISTSATEFAAMDSSRRFLTTWSSHSTQYGISRRAVHQALESGDVVLNVSRSEIPGLEQTLEAMGCDVAVVVIEASPAVLQARLQSRGRETSEQIAFRIARQPSIASRNRVWRVRNDADVDSAVTALLEILTGTMKCSLWVMPAVNSDIFARTKQLIGVLADQNSVAPFDPHITLCPSVACQSDQIESTARDVAKEIGGPVEVVPSTATVSETQWNRAVVLEAPGVSIEHASLAARRALDRCGSAVNLSLGGYAPHISFLYGIHPDVALFASAVEVTGLRLSPFQCSALCVVHTPTPAWSNWVFLARIPL